MRTLLAGAPTAHGMSCRGCEAGAGAQRPAGLRWCTMEYESGTSHQPRRCCSISGCRKGLMLSGGRADGSSQAASRISGSSGDRRGVAPVAATASKKQMSLRWSRSCHSCTHTANNPATSIDTPVSSSVSRAAASSKVSPGSACPPGSSPRRDAEPLVADHEPFVVASGDAEGRGCCGPLMRHAVSLSPWVATRLAVSSDSGPFGVVGMRVLSQRPAGCVGTFPSLSRSLSSLGGMTPRRHECDACRSGCPFHVAKGVLPGRRLWSRRCQEFSWWVVGGDEPSARLARPAR